MPTSFGSPLPSSAVGNPPSLFLFLLPLPSLFLIVVAPLLLHLPASHCRPHLFSISLLPPSPPFFSFFSPCYRSHSSFFFSLLILLLPPAADHTPHSSSAFSFSLPTDHRYSFHLLLLLSASSADPAIAVVKSLSIFISTAVFSKSVVAQSLSFSFKSSDPATVTQSLPSFFRS